MKQLKVMLDSGAFSAHKSGKVIVLEEYIRFIKDHEDKLHHYVNLDVIPNSRDVEESAKAGWSNYRRMVKAGLKPIPVYHQGENWDWLKRMVEFGATYIGVGGIARDPSRRRRQDWLREVWGYLGKFNPVKVHVFGMTLSTTAFELPFFSMDSIAWRYAPGCGHVLIPRWVASKYQYDRPPASYIVASRSKNGVIGRSDHIDSFAGEWVLKYIDDYLRTVGTTLAEARISEKARIIAAINYLRTVSEKTKNFPKLYFTCEGGSSARLLTSQGVKRLLISYPYAKQSGLA